MTRDLRDVVQTGVGEVVEVYGRVDEVLLYQRDRIERRRDVGIVGGRREHQRRQSTVVALRGEAAQWEVQSGQHARVPVQRPLGVQAGPIGRVVHAVPKLLHYRLVRRFRRRRLLQLQLQLYTTSQSLLL